MDSLKSTIESHSAKVLAIMSKLTEDMVTVKRGLREMQRNQANERNSKEEANEWTLRKWMESEVKLPQYFEMLMENGFEDMESLKDITMEHLREMGIDKIGHRLRLMKSVAALKADDDS